MDATKPLRPRPDPLLLGALLLCGVARGTLPEPDPMWLAGGGGRLFSTHQVSTPADGNLFVDAKSRNEPITYCREYGCVRSLYNYDDREVFVSRYRFLCV